MKQVKILIPRFNNQQMMRFEDELEMVIEVKEKIRFDWIHKSIRSNGSKVDKICSAIDFKMPEINPNYLKNS